MTKSRTLKEIDATTAHEWLVSERAVLIDIREEDEYAREHIQGARLVPLSGFNPTDFPKDHEKVGVFHCGSGARTANAAAQILRTGFAEVYHIEGGLKGWKEGGLPTNVNARIPIPVMRQVQIAAGSLVLLGILLTWVWSPAWSILSAFVGVGLVFAGITGWCGLANLLSFMPWNRVLQSSPLKESTSKA